MTSQDKLFSPVKLGALELPNRFAMAPMTRSRATPEGFVTPATAEYYAQRASVGLIVTEGVHPSDAGQGYPMTPRIYNDEQVGSWKEVTSQVHAQGGHIYMQIMHVGRVSHPDNTPYEGRALAPSAIPPNDQIITPTGMQDIPTPQEMTKDDIAQAVKDFAHAAKCAIEAGADGVEIHGANGYLITQFLAPSANQRTDEYGGSIENRARFAIEVARAVADAIGAERTGIRLSPGITLLGISDGEEGPALYRYLTAELNKIGLAYMHVLFTGNEELMGEMREIWDQVFILNRPSRSRDMIGADVESGLADMESYGQMVLANPDFVKRIKENAPLNEPDQTTYYGGNEKGYTDYPALEG